MNIKDTFIRLTSKTYPYGHEDMLEPFLPVGFKTDIDGNYFYEVGSDNKVIFASHLDTACKTHTDVVHRFDGKLIKTNGKTILGADDKAGVTVLLYMIYKNVPGLYYFFVGEEVGCIGSTAASKRTEFFSKYDMIVSFDRRGKKSIITHQSGTRTCSDKFAESLSKEFSKFGLDMDKDDTGVYTDSAEFSRVIPECTNISVGYDKEHTHTESQDIIFLEDLCKASVLINWKGLDIARDPSKVEKKESGYYFDGDVYYTSSSRNSRKSGFYGDGGSKRSRRGGRKNKQYFTDEDLWNSEEISNLVNNKAYYNDLENELIRVSDNGFNDNFVTMDNSKSIFNSDPHKTDYYRGIRRFLLNDTLNSNEFKIIKDQCLNLTDESDREFARYIDDQIIA